MHLALFSVFAAMYGPSRLLSLEYLTRVPACLCSWGGGRAVTLDIRGSLIAYSAVAGAAALWMATLCEGLGAGDPMWADPLSGALPAAWMGER
jgi:hypothetical protein